METLKSLFVKPDPQAQFRKCNALIRTNIRKLDRDVANAKRAEIQAKNLILQADRRAQRDPARAEQAQREVRDFARELIRTRRSTTRLITGRAQLSSVQMQVSEAFAMRKIEGSIQASVGVMRDVNRLIRLPELAATMQELSVELMKAGIVEEMTSEILPEDGDVLFEDEEAEADSEVDKVLGEILKDRMATTGPMPAMPVAAEPAPVAAVPAARVKPVAMAAGGPEGAEAEDEEDEEDTEAMMDQMRNRLESLRS